MTIDSGLSKGTMTTTGMLTVWAQDNKWQWGELKGKYVKFGPQSPNFSSRIYRIIDNTKSSFTLSCARTCATSAKTLVDGTSFEIMATDYIMTLSEIKTYKFVAIKVTSQILKEELSPSIRTWDWGVRFTFDEAYYFPNQETVDGRMKISDYNGRLVADKKTGQTREFTLEFNAMSENDFKTLEFMYVQTVDYDKKFWYVPSPVSRRKPYLVTASKNLEDNRLIDQGRSAKMTLREI
jgi:hypothetical protein